MAAADRSNADLRRRLAVDTAPPPQIPKDKPGVDNDMPLSPQWLLPKLGENKEPSSHGPRFDAAKASGNVEDMSNTGKRRDVFRSSVLDGETGRRDRWRDDEREPNSAIRRTRWRETDKEHGDMRKAERWSEDPKHSVEARRAPQDRWGDSANKEGNYDQRRENKWSTRWGPNDKESENWRDKWTDSCKESDGSREKGFLHYTAHGKDGNNHEKDSERDDNLSRSWKSSYTVGRGKGDASHHLSQTPQKSSGTSGYGRGRPENESQNFFSSRGKFTSGTSTISSGSLRPFHLGLLSDRPAGASGDRSTHRYSRMKLLDIYRTTDVTNFKMPLDGCEEVSSLMQEDPLEPLALSAPTAEEAAILKGIDKGDIINSGVYQASKDGSVGKNNTDVVQSKQSRLGNREDQPVNMEDYKVEMTSTRGISGNADVASRGESSRPDTPSNYVVPQRSWSIGERRHGPSVELGQQISDVLDEDSKVGGTISVGGVASPMQLHPNPENLSLCYKDPQGRIQGPFTGADLIGWFEAGYFGIDLLVRVASAPPDAPFLLLGDVMPHLRAKARPPPGFGTAKQSDMPEPSPTGKFVSSSGTLAGAAGVGIFESGPVSRSEGAIEAQNRFLESLMSNNMHNPSAESMCISGGMNEYGASNFGNVAPVGGESGNNMNYLLAQARFLERQNSSNPPPYWPGDAMPVPQAQKKDSVAEVSTLHSKLLPPMADPSRQNLQSQNVDLLPMLHSTDKPQAATVNSGLPLWSNNPAARHINPNMHGIEIPQAALNVLHNLQNSQQIGLGVQQHNFIPPNQPQLVNLSSQAIQPEKLLSEISQDPQLLNMMQQQYLLAQLQMQAQPPVTPQPQLSLLDKMLLLKQQQQQQLQQQLQQEQQQQQLQQQLQQEQQQHQLLLQQQHLLSQVLCRGHPNQQPDDSLYGSNHASVPSVDPSLNLHLRRMQEALEVDQKSVCSLHDGQQPPHPNVNMRGTEGVGFAQSTGALPMPHEIFGRATRKELDALIPQHGEGFTHSDAHPAKAFQQISPFAKSADDHEEESVNCRQDVIVPEMSIQMNKIETDSRKALGSASTEIKKATVYDAEGFPEPSQDTSKSEDVLSHVSNLVNEMNISSENIPETALSESAVATEVQVPETQETKKAEKKTKKLKKKQTAADAGRGAPKTLSSQQPRKEMQVERSDLGGTKSDLPDETEEMFWSSPVKAENSLKSAAEPPLGFESSEVIPLKGVPEEFDNVRGEWELGAVSSDAQAAASHRAWKPTPGLRPKSLLEIQAEEQLRAKRGLTLENAKASQPASSVSSIPWNGMAATFEEKFGGVTQATTSVPLGDPENASNSKSKRSQLHDLLAEEVLGKSSEVDSEIASNANGASFPPLSTAVQSDALALHDNDFIEAKDSKKNRKKATKAKGSVLKPASPVVGSLDLSTAAVPIEKGKSAKQALQEKEILPAPPSGPSLGDFVPWRSDQANSVPAPAWSTDSGKMQKPLSLRVIQREQERRAGIVQQQVPATAPAKMPQNQRNNGNNSSWQASGSSPSKAAAPVQISSHASTQSKSNVEDDLFWGPSEHSKQEKKQSEFPSLSNQSRGSAVKEQASALYRQKSLVSRPPAPSAPSGNHAAKCKAEAANKQTEAMDFRDWCESEWIRLTGTTDTSFLEYCIRQSSSEAEMILRENIGSLDRNGEFIDKFIKYKDFLSSEVIEMAFQANSSRGTHADGAGLSDSSAAAAKGGTGADMELGQEAGGKKKGKKGKKVSAAVLGFNVVSNRIMMGEIQNLDD